MAYNAETYKLPDPTAEREVQRLNGQHFTVWNALGHRLHTAPMHAFKGKKVLDVGCGSAAWLRHFNEMYPDAELYGVDLTPPAAHLLPAGCAVFAGDATHDWASWLPDPDMRFDFVASRLLTCGLTSDGWRAFAEQASKHLAPGGWFENFDYAHGIYVKGDQTQAPLTTKWVTKYLKVLRDQGHDPYAIVHLPDYLQGAALVNVSQDPVQILLDTTDGPAYPSPGVSPAYAKAAYRYMAESSVLMYDSMTGDTGIPWLEACDKADLEGLKAEVRAPLDERQIYFDGFITKAQKPT